MDKAIVFDKYNIKLIYGDCLGYLPQQSNVDLILTDPPYNISQGDRFSLSMNRFGLDFGEWDHGFNLIPYIGVFGNILKSGGSLICFTSWQNLGNIEKESKNFGLSVRNLVRLEKSNPMPRNINRKYVVDCEYALWLTKSGKWTFNRLDKYERPKYVTTTAHKWHPTEKNVKVLERMINIHSDVGELVIDPFMGSGSTGIACINTKRKFIGIEKDDKTFGLALKRISDYIEEIEHNHT